MATKLVFRSFKHKKRKVSTNFSFTGHNIREIIDIYNEQ